MLEPSRGRMRRRAASDSRLAVLSTIEEGHEPLPIDRPVAQRLCAECPSVVAMGGLVGALDDEGVNMDAQNFAFWLNGFVELTQGQTPNPAQWKSICEHLATVFQKVTPPVQTGVLPGTPDPAVGVDWQKYFQHHPVSRQVHVTC